MNVVEGYFAAAEPSLWQWQDDGNVVVWADGATIAFRAELAAVYRRLQTQSLPPFGAVLLLLAACRDGWSEAPSRAGLLAGPLSGDVHDKRLALLQYVTGGLDAIHALPAALRQSLVAKAELAALVFEKPGDSAPPAVYERLLDELEHGLSEASLRPQRTMSSVDRLLHDLATLAPGLPRVSATALALRMQTGLEQLVVPVEVELPPAGTARSLLGELDDDPELGGVARLAKLLLAAVHLPAPLSLPEELPLGGVSDISNRGTLDRLLLSELANDGLTLAVRVAMNEALYLRRETPPSPPVRRRVVLLDSGLRMWGVPRVFGASVGLALAAGAVEGIDVDVYRAAGPYLADVDFTTAAGLTEHLAALDHRVQPGESLAALRETADAAVEATDVVIVTADDVYADPAFQRALAEAAFAEVHVAVVDRDGAFRLHLHTARGRKIVRQAQFALDDVLFPPRKPTLALVDERRRLPAIFGVRPFPLLLSTPIDVDRSWSVDDVGALTLARDGRLLHWFDANVGARQLAENLPPGGLHWAATSATDGEIQFLLGKLSAQGLYAATLSLTGGVRCVQLQHEVAQPRYAFIHDGTAFVGNAEKLWAGSTTTGERLAERSITGHTHLRSRLFTTYRPTTKLVVYRAASYDGLEIKLAEFHNEPGLGERVTSVWEAAGIEGPLGATNRATIIEFGSGRRRNVRRFAHDEEVEVRDVSRDGRRVLLGGRASPSTSVLVNLEDMSNTVVYAGTTDLESRLKATARSVVLRHRFLAIGVDVEGRLTLVGRRDTLWPLEFRDDTLRLASQPVDASLRVRRSFQTFDAGPANRYGLGAAQFTDGSRAVLDARGLLHLKSSDDALPEATIVLTEGATAGWLSDGGCWGSAYFVHESQSTLQPRRIRSDYVERFAERLQ